jgi:hypothetical protein
MTTRQHVTHRTTSSGLKSTTKEPLKKGSPGPEELTSFHSIFHPWELGGSSGSYTTSCIGGETTISADRSRARSIEIWSSADQNNRSNIWPFVEDSGGIAKVVDVEISVSQTPDPESEWKARDLEEGAGFWRMRDEDQIQQPERAMIGISRGNSIAEWERLPDLLPVDEADEKSSLGSRDTGRQSPIPNPLRAHPI